MSINKSISTNKKLLISLLNWWNCFVSCIKHASLQKFRGSAPNAAGGVTAPSDPTYKAPPFTAGYAPTNQFFFQFLTVSRTLHFKISGKRRRSTAQDVKTVRDTQDWTHAYFSVSPCCFSHTRRTGSSPWADEYSSPTELTPACINARVSSFPEREAPGKVHIRMMKRLSLNKGVTARIVPSTLREIKMIFFLFYKNTTLFPWEHSFIFLLGNCWRTSEEYTS